MEREQKVSVQFNIKYYILFTAQRNDKVEMYTYDYGNCQYISVVY